jgi:putative spermidine/putrescine transport system permease protein
MSVAEATSPEAAEERRGLLHRVFVTGIFEPLRRYPLGLYPTIMLGVFFFIPFVIMIDISFWHRVESRTYERAFELTHYARFFSPLFTRHLWVSIEFSALASACCLIVAVPFTYFLSRFRRRPQVVALVFVLCVLSLSEVIIAYSWSVLLSRSAGIPKLLFELGLMEDPTSLFPGFWAVLCGLTYFNVPLAILVLYPQSTRLDRELTEAAQTLGASPVVTFWTVVIPLLWKAILACFILLFVFTMGAFVTPLWLGEPENTMYAQLIANQMLSRNNAPFAAALGVFLVVVTLALVTITFWLGKERSAVAGARR